MKILQVVPDLDAGGVERTTLEVVETLVAAGHEAHVASAGGRLEQELKALGGILHKFDVGSKNPFKIPSNKKALIRVIRDHDIDLIHARSRMPAWPALGAAKATDTPFVTTYHGIYNAKGAIKRRYNAVMAEGKIIIANSEYTKAHIIREHGTDPNKITVIPRGVDMVRFDPKTIKPDAVRQKRAEWNISFNQTLVLLPGRLTRWKGQSVAIEALAHLPDNMVLVCLGDAQGREDYVTELKTLSDHLGLTDRVRLPGHSSDMPTALMAADVVVSASTDPEAFGRVSAEAQAMGKRVVATAHGGSLETILEGDTGILVKPADPDALADGITASLEMTGHNPQAARDRIAANFSKTSLQAAVLDVYRRALL